MTSTDEPSYSDAILSYMSLLQDRFEKPARVYVGKRIFRKLADELRRNEIQISTSLFGIPDFEKLRKLRDEPLTHVYGLPIEEMDWRDEGIVVTSQPTEVAPEPSGEWITD